MREAAVSWDTGFDEGRETELTAVRELFDWPRIFRMGNIYCNRDSEEGSCSLVPVNRNVFFLCPDYFPGFGGKRFRFC